MKIGRRKSGSLMKEDNLKAIRARAYKPRTTNSKGTTAAQNLLADIKVEKCAVGKFVGEELTSSCEAAAFVLGGLARSVDAPDNRLEFGTFDDGGYGDFSLEKSISHKR